MLDKENKPATIQGNFDEVLDVLDNTEAALGITLDLLMLYMDLTDRNLKVFERKGEHAAAAYLDSHRRTESLLLTIAAQLKRIQGNLSQGIAEAYTCIQAENHQEEARSAE